MIRIIHLTDFHLNPTNLKDWNDYVKEALLKKLKIINGINPVNIIAFTGDMIDLGGKDYASARIAFDNFRDEVMMPIINELKLQKNQFLVIPGNHDVVRSSDKLFTNIGLTKYFEEKINITTFISNAIEKDEQEGIKRMLDYKDFEKDLYSTEKSNYVSMFGSSFQFKFSDLKVGVCCLNSAWRCYDSNNDKGNLLIGEEQLIRCHKFISDCDVKIALVHHPLDWLSDVESKTIHGHLMKDFDLLLTGHVHESKTNLHSGFNGTMFINIAPSGLNDIRTDSRTFANGFTVIDFNKTKREIDCEYWRYNHAKIEFVLNTDEGDNGKYSMGMPTLRSNRKSELINDIISNIQQDHFKEMDDHLIGVKSNLACSTLKEAFVLPPIDEGNANKSDNNELENKLSLQEIVKLPNDLMLFGSQESGKTTILYRLVREYVDEFEYTQKIPVYIDFEEIGNKEILTCIKEYLRCSTEDSKYLLGNNIIVLLIDNLNYDKNSNDYEQVKKLHKFYKEINLKNDDGRYIKIIATGKSEISGILPESYLELCEIPFKNLYIRNLRAKEIKTIMHQWLPNEEGIKADERLEKLVSSFNSYALPSNAMSVSLFLWSMENKEKKPINHAVLLEIYIEIILEKLNVDNIYRESFDFTNKIQLLAKIAQEMLSLDQPGYTIPYSQFVGVIEKYIKKEVGFDFETSVIVEYFLNKKIFVKTKGNLIKFTYSCFFNFFIAKRMEYDPVFREFVMQEDKYFLFIREIDYYTGLTRSDINLFKLILERFEKEFKPTDYVLEKLDFDEYFTKQGKEFEALAKNVEISKIKDSRPSEKKLEEYYNRRLSQIKDPSSILKKQGSKALDMLIIIMSNVLRNSEGVEDLELKKHAYSILIKYNLIWMVLYREYLLDYVSKNKKLPASIPTELTLEYILKNIPYHVQFAMYQNLGTPKLAPIIADKIIQDSKGKGITNTDLEKYLSVTLYSDIHGKDCHKYLMAFAKKVGNNIVRDFFYMKNIYYYFRRTKPNSPNEKVYLDILTVIRMRSLKYPQRMKEQVRKAIEDSKRIFQNKSD